MSVSAAAISAGVLIASLRPTLDRDNAVTSPALGAGVTWEEPPRRRGRAYLQPLGRRFRLGAARMRPDRVARPTTPNSDKFGPCATV
jgi:hypothetical protein